jgi:eukaryotic-like serine/threonine-protein kinase
MPSNPDVLTLLEEILDSGRSPEEVCRDCPELLPEVRRRWRAFRLVDGSLAALFPDPETPPRADAILALPRPADLPQVPGYRVEALLGHGGMGVVYRAWHLRLDRAVALKMLLAGPCARPVELERFLREAQAVAALRHPNIVQVHDVGDVEGRPYFTMEFVEGGNLAEQIQGVPQPARQAAALVTTLADAIHAAHQSGIVHRDLKPANILLTRDGTPKVTDFGLARRLEGDRPHSRMLPEQYFPGTPGQYCEGLTLSGVAVGTPSYMTPEQARGDKGALGPATDVYALGAILYELLTGRPPFCAESAPATLRQVLADEPAPPGRLNPGVPRDLETICLKCLHKESPRRYASAAALADDLRRFEKGEPITARPVGAVERGARWLRRHPALAVGVLLVLTFTGVGAWWYGQQAAAERAAEGDVQVELRQAEQFRQTGDYASAAAALEKARVRLGKAGRAALHERLDRASAAVELVRRLDAIRIERALIKPQADRGADKILSVTAPPDDDHALRSGSAPGRRYEEAFRDAGVGAPEDDPAEVATRVRASPVRGALVAALDDWAACAADRDQQAWVLAVVRQADPDPWRDRVRDRATWDNPEALRDLADRAPLAEQSPQLLAVLGARLRARDLDAVAFLERVASAYPTDFWVNIEMGNALYHQSNPVEAIGYYRAALALRPQTVSLHYALGGLYLGLHRWGGAVAEYEQAIRLDPDNAWCHIRLGFTLVWKGGSEDEAIAQFREAIRCDANIGWSHFFLAIALENKGCLDEAVDEFREAARLLPEKRAEARRRLRDLLLLKLGRGAEARAIWKEDLAAHPPNHDDWFGYAELCLFLRAEAEYRRARRDLLAQFGTVTERGVAERVGRACLLLPAPEDELRQAVALTERAVAGGRLGHEFAFPFFLFAEGLARYRQGRFDDAVKLMNGEAAFVMGPSPRLVLAMAQYQKGQKDQARKTLAAAVVSYDWSASKAGSHDEWIAHVLRREAEALIR